MMASDRDQHEIVTCLMERFGKQPEGTGIKNHKSRQGFPWEVFTARSDDGRGR